MSSAPLCWTYMDHVGTCAVCTRGLLCWLRWAATLSVGDTMRLGCVRVYPHSLHPSCMGTAPPPMSTVGCALRPVSLGEKCGTPVIKSTPSPNTPSGCKLRPVGHLVWDLVWTRAQFFLSMRHLPLAVPSWLPHRTLSC